MKSNPSLESFWAKLLTPFALALVGTISLGETAAQALTFNFTGTDTIDPLYRDNIVNGFKSGDDLWSSLFSDDVIININISFETLEPSTLGGTISTKNFFSYTNVCDSLFADATSADNATAISYLQSNPSFDLLINNTADNPYAPFTEIPYFDKRNHEQNRQIFTGRHARTWH